jgi:hypothetical protein
LIVVELEIGRKLHCYWVMGMFGYIYSSAYLDYIDSNIPLI